MAFRETRKESEPVDGDETSAARRAIVARFGPRDASVRDAQIAGVVAQRPAGQTDFCGRERAMPVYESRATRQVDSTCALDVAQAKLRRAAAFASTTHLPESAFRKTRVPSIDAFVLFAEVLH